MDAQRVYIACAEGEDHLAERLASPLKAAGYDVLHDGQVMVGESLVGEAARAVAGGYPIVLCATARAAGSRWTQKIVNAGHTGDRTRLFVVIMDEHATVDHLALRAKVARYHLDPDAAVRELLAALAKHFPARPSSAPPEIPPAQSGGQFLDGPSNATVFDVDAVAEFREEVRPEVAARHPSTLSPWEFLDRTQLRTCGRLTRTGALLFTIDPTATCPSAMVKCARYFGTDRSATRDPSTVEGPIARQVAEARRFVARYARVGERPSAERAESGPVYDLPMVAVREIIVNALVHRDYSQLDSCVHVRLFDDRLEVSSPGTWASRGLTGGQPVDLAELEGQSVKRNFRLAHMMSWIRLVEGEGSGIPTALSDCAGFGARPPVVVQEGGFVTVTLWRRSDLRPSTDAPRSAPVTLPSFRSFTGRHAELDRVADRLTGRPKGSGVVISGMGGVGKTYLAVAAARRVLSTFPDGALFVDMSRYADDDHVEVMTRLLSSLGVAVKDVPFDEAAITALYHRVLAGRRVLLVLDAARSTQQVRTLLPADFAGAALVTSRHALSGLVLHEGMDGIVLDAMNLDEGLALLRSLLGDDRVDLEIAAATRLVELSGGLPLALAVIGARARDMPGDRLNRLVADLEDSSRRLDALDTGEGDTSVRSAMDWSYRALSEEAARLFRRLSSHPGPDFGVDVVASMAGTSRRTAQALLRELTRSNIVHSSEANRYSLHDLVAVFAEETAASTDSPQERDTVALRMFNHYLGTGMRAALLFDPFREPIDVDAAVLGSTPAMSTYEDALAWFTRERRAMLEVVRLAVSQGRHEHVWKLVWTMSTFLDRDGHARDHVAAQHTALDSARRAGDVNAQATTHRLLGHAYTRLGVYQEGSSHYRESLRVFQALGDLHGQTHAHYALSRVLGFQGDHATAVSHAQRAYELYGALGNQVRQARALNQLGSSHARLGDYRRALECCEQALRLFEEHRDDYYRAATSDNLGYINHRLGHYDRAIGHYRLSIDLYWAASDQHSAASTLSRMGDTYIHRGDPPSAERAWREALGILDDLEHPEAEVVRRKLTGLTGPRGGSPS
ncbi:tetratricopeptide repeat protein [Saccharothrix sp. NRRL B-16314]|uniref:tetratricopeptide repeat protein n=1 Tax=Saccharothrix sp. NRRL B-16314 TaxID=1463825 RepID=UPI00068979EB|nr:tetratricopeptide repeat protein [Saccharothrix sp. NRRL B-16314]